MRWLTFWYWILVHWARVWCNAMRVNNGCMQCKWTINVCNASEDKMQHADYETWRKSNCALTTWEAAISSCTCVCVGCLNILSLSGRHGDKTCIAAEVWKVLIVQQGTLIRPWCLHDSIPARYKYMSIIDFMFVFQDATEIFYHKLICMDLPCFRETHRSSGTWVVLSFHLPTNVIAVKVLIMVLVQLRSSEGWNAHYLDVSPLQSKCQKRQLS